MPQMNSNQEADPTAPEGPDLSSSEFNTSKGGPQNVPVPAPAPLVEHNIPTPPAAAGSGSSGSDGGSGVPFGAIGSIAGSVVGGPIGGAIGGFLGNLFGAQGGLMQTHLAEGGQPQDQRTVDLTLAYLTGALHQQKYGGTPDTLGTAAQEVKDKLMPQQQSQGFAAGGDATADTKATDQLLLMRALGLLPSSSPGSEDQAGNQQQAAPGISSNTANAMTSGVIPRQQQAAAPARGNNGYMNGYAAGGPDEQPMLQPGQQFQGDGSVKGPGGPQDDAIPAKLSNGEFVMAADATQFYGVDKLVKMNEQGKQGFMDAMHQVQANQPGASAGPPGASQSAVMPPLATPLAQPQMPPQQPPMGQAKGGPSLTMRKNSGYMGL